MFGSIIETAKDVVVGGVNLTAEGVAVSPVIALDAVLMATNLTMGIFLGYMQFAGSMLGIDVSAPQQH